MSERHWSEHTLRAAVIAVLCVTIAFDMFTEARHGDVWSWLSGSLYLACGVHFARRWFIERGRVGPF